MDNLIQETVNSLQSLQQQIRLQPRPKPADMATSYEEKDKKLRREFSAESVDFPAAESTACSPGLSSQPWDMSSQGDTSLDMNHNFDEVYSDVGSQVFPSQSLVLMQSTGMDPSFTLESHLEKVPTSKGSPPYQKFGPVKPLPTEESWLEAAIHGCPNPYTRKMLHCEMGQERDMPKPVDHMDGWPIAPRLYPPSPTRPSPRPSPRLELRRERSIESHVQRQRSASLRRQESRERSLVRDPWLESTFNRNPGSASFSRGNIRSIAGYDSPKRAKRMTAEVAPTLTERSRFSWTQDIELNLERMRRLRAKVKGGVTSPTASPAPSPQSVSRNLGPRNPPASAEAFCASARQGGRPSSSSSPGKASRKIVGHEGYEKPLENTLKRSSCDSSLHSTFRPSATASTPAMTARDPLISSRDPLLLPWNKLSMISPPMSPYEPMEDVELGEKASPGTIRVPADQVLRQASEPVKLRMNTQDINSVTSGKAAGMTSAPGGKPPASAQARQSLGSEPSQNCKMDISSAYSDYFQTDANEAPQLQVPTESMGAAHLPSRTRRVSAPMIVNAPSVASFPRHTLMSPQVEQRFPSVTKQPQPLMSQQTPWTFVAIQQLPHEYPVPKAAGGRSTMYGLDPLRP